MPPWRACSRLAHPAKAPYDVIFVEGGVETIPDALQAQLADGGRLVAVGVDSRIGRAFLLHKGDGLIAPVTASRLRLPC